ncbi:MAG: hypothetical protein ACR2NV_06110, partial [Thermoleophilaceae bacterium]
LPGDPTKTEEVAALLHERTGGDEGEFVRRAWVWAGKVSSSRQDAETAYFAVLSAGGVQPPPAAADPDPEPAGPAPKPDPDPEPETEPDEADDDPEQPARAPAATPDHEPLPGDLLARLEALTRRVEAAPTTTAAAVPKWDPDETPTITGQVALAEWADLRQRGGAVRILVLLTEHGPVEIWCSWQQLAALLRAQELAHGRTLQPGDLLAIRAAGKQRIGKSRSPSRLFTLSIEWAS